MLHHPDEEFQGIVDQLSLKEVNALQAVQESHKEVTANIVEHPSNQDVEDYMGIIDKVKDQVEEVKQQYEDFKIKINEYIVSS